MKILLREAKEWQKKRQRLLLRQQNEKLTQCTTIPKVSNSSLSGAISRISRAGPPLNITLFGI